MKFSLLLLLITLPAAGAFAHGDKDHSESPSKEETEAKPEQIEKIDGTKLEAIDLSYRISST